MPHRLETIGVDRWDRLFLTVVPEALRVFSNPPDSQHFGGPPSRTTLSPPRSLMARGPSPTLRAKAEYPMLPGFRFLLAAIVLSISLLIFGLGAAALLRAAHEEFASIPSRRALPETLFAQRDDAGPTLALARIEPSAADQRAAMATELSDSVPDQAAIVSAPPEPEQPAEEADKEPDKIATLIDAAMPAKDSLLASTSEIPVQIETSAEDDSPSPVAETKLASSAEVTPTASPDQVAVTAPN